MKNSFCLGFLTILAVVCSSVTLATPMGFIDLGNSTIDKNTGLEWLDLSETSSNEYWEDPIGFFTNLESRKGLGAEGWRFATQDEYKGLLKNFYGIQFEDQTFDGTQSICSESVVVCSDVNLSQLTNKFIDIFMEEGRSADLESNFLIFGGFLMRDYSEGFVESFLSGQVLWYAGIGGDDIFVSDRIFVYSGPFFDDSWGNPNAPIGFYLVRNVSEPSIILLLVLGLTWLGFSRRKALCR